MARLDVRKVELPQELLISPLHLPILVNFDVYDDNITWVNTDWCS